MDDKDIVLNIPLGKLRGKDHDGFLSFHAVPYAKPPVGPLRFSPPVPAGPWSGERDARQPGPVPPQKPSRIETCTGPVEMPQNEDCLHLSIWTPAVGGAGKPVAVWLHGGGFITGGGSLPWYDGGRLSQEGDIVVVTVGYRIGALGFLCLPGVSPGNLGLRDQLAALEWIRDNISYFGGDPENITLMGQSAGAISIALLQARQEPNAPLAQRAILQSTPLGLVLYDNDQAEDIGRVFLNALGIDEAAPNAREEACKASVEAILEAQTAAFKYVVARSEPGSTSALPFIPVADGDFLPSPAKMEDAMRRAAGEMDVLIGTTQEESNIFYYRQDLAALAGTPIPASDQERLAAQRPGASQAQLLMDYSTEQMFQKPSLEWALEASGQGRRAYTYLFTYPSPDKELLSTHCLELPFVFGTMDAFDKAPMVAGMDPQKVGALSAGMRASWISYIRNGSPQASALPWPSFRSACRATMRFGEVSGAVDFLGRLDTPEAFA